MASKIDLWENYGLAAVFRANRSSDADLETSAPASPLLGRLGGVPDGIRRDLGVTKMPNEEEIAEALCQGGGVIDSFALDINLVLPGANVIERYVRTLIVAMENGSIIDEGAQNLARRIIFEASSILALSQMFSKAKSVNSVAEMKALYQECIAAVRSINDRLLGGRFDFDGSVRNRLSESFHSKISFEVTSYLDCGNFVFAWCYSENSKMSYRLIWIKPENGNAITIPETEDLEFGPNSGLTYLKPNAKINFIPFGDFAFCDSNGAPIVVFSPDGGSLEARGPGGDKPVKRQAHNLGRDYVGNDIRLEGEQFSRVHALISIWQTPNIPSTVTVVDRGSTNGTYIRPICQLELAKKGDSFTLFKPTAPFVFVEPDGKQVAVFEVYQDEDNGEYLLRAANYDGFGGTVDAKSEISLGRDLDQDICLDSNEFPRVSRKHLSVFVHSQTGDVTINNLGRVGSEFLI